MTLFKVKLDGGQKEPERTSELTVEADNANAAKTFAEEHNPGLTATDAEKVTD
jgi:hypothetical protein